MGSARVGPRRDPTFRRCGGDRLRRGRLCQRVSMRRARHTAIARYGTFFRHCVALDRVYTPVGERGASEAREGGICHHVARRRARGAANRVHRAAGSRARNRRGAARSVLAAGGPAQHGRPAHGRARRERERLERERLEREQPNAAPSAARRAGRQRPAVVESKGRPRASRRNLPAL